MYLDCDCYNYSDCKTRQHCERQTNTQANGCQFSVAAVELSNFKL